MTLAHPATRSTLDAILAQARRDGVEFPYCVANHLPMALVALDGLGAPPARLEQWNETYRATNGLISVPAPVATIVAANFDEALGDRAREADWRAFFAGEVARLGADGAIQLYLPRLVQGVAASALHPLMRLAFGLMTADNDEIAVALAYWATAFLPLPAPTGAAPVTDDPAEVLACVAEIEGVRSYQTETDLLWHNIRAVGALPGFCPVVDRLGFSPDTPSRMARTALALFVGTMDFAALHAVTGLHWVRTVGYRLPEREPLYRAFWQVIAALVPKIGFPSLPSADEIGAMRHRAAPPWAEIKAAAIRSDDEHDISLTFSAFEEEKIWGDSLYRIAAARRLGLIA